MTRTEQFPGHETCSAKSRKASGQRGWLITLINPSSWGSENLREGGRKKASWFSHLTEKKGELGRREVVVRRLVGLDPCNQMNWDWVHRSAVCGG